MNERRPVEPEQVCYPVPLALNYAIDTLTWEGAQAIASVRVGKHPPFVRQSTRKPTIAISRIPSADSRVLL